MENLPGQTMFSIQELSPRMAPQSPSFNCDLTMARRQGRCQSPPAPFGRVLNDLVNLTLSLTLTSENQSTDLKVKIRINRNRVIKEAHHAEPGAADEGYGSLRGLFPELKEIDTEMVIRDLHRMRSGE